MVVIEQAAAEIAFSKRYDHRINHETDLQPCIGIVPYAPALHAADRRAGRPSQRMKVDGGPGLSLPSHHDLRPDFQSEIERLWRLSRYSLEQRTTAFEFADHAGGTPRIGPDVEGITVDEDDKSRCALRTLGRSFDG